MVELGLDWSSFICLTPLEYDYKLRAYHRKVERQWEQTRFIAWAVFMNNANRTRKDKKLSPSDLVPLSFDKELRKKFTQEELQQGLREAKPFLKKLHAKKYGKRQDTN